MLLQEIFSFRVANQLRLWLGLHLRLHFLAEWWKQLYGESEGKDGKGIFPASVDMTTDLHSLGQYIQDGQRILFETMISVKKPRQETYHSA